MSEMQQATGGAALLVIDMINDLDFPEGSALLDELAGVADVAAALIETARESGVPVVFVNDNFGNWCGHRAAIFDHVRNTPGAAILERLKLRDDDYFILKPQVSGFYATNLSVLLPRLGANRLILTGVAADICVLFTAADAHMREYDLWVPCDAVASENADHRDWALEIMAKSMRAETRSTSECSLNEWLRR
jgi:nicotinamidase-related amidase